MKIITYNVNGIRAAVKKGFNEFFQEIDADILTIQETKCQEGEEGGVEEEGQTNKTRSRQSSIVWPFIF